MSSNLFKVKSENADRFWAQVDRTGGPDSCWPWTGSHNKHGYGKFRTKLRGRVTTAWQTLNASRVALILSSGKDLAGLNACHKCDNPTCCNPKHLYAGTQSDNMRDAYIRGRR